jgi:uncharacterized glyoxalase superfamily protein PhnB
MRSSRAMLSNRTMPTGVLMPELVYEDVGEACEWLCRVFGFTERWRAGNHRAQLAAGDCALVVMGRGGAGEPREGMAHATAPGAPISHAVMMRVADVNHHFERARAEGAQLLDEPRDFPYGERQYNAIDLGGHQWTFSQSIADVAPEEWGGTSAA